MYQQWQGHSWDPQRHSHQTPIVQSYAQAYPPRQSPCPHPPNPPNPPPAAHSYGPYYPLPARHSLPPPGQPRPSRGRDYLQSLHTDMSNLALNSIQPVQPILHAGHSGTRHQPDIASLRTDKPLPRLPPPPTPPRPYQNSTSSTDAYSQPIVSGSNGQTALTDYNLLQSTPPRVPDTTRIHPTPSLLSTFALPRPPPTNPQSIPSRTRPVAPPAATFPKAFRSTTLSVPAIHESQSEPRLARLSKSAKSKSKDSNAHSRKSWSRSSDPIYVPGSDSESDNSPSPPLANRARRKAATSDFASRATRPSPRNQTRLETPDKTEAQSSSPFSLGTPGKSASVKCAGYTRKGAPCQRLVKAAAPYLSVVDPNTEEERLAVRYCKDHAGMICTPKGFYWRTDKEANSVWIEFSDFIPEDLGQQTQALLRTTMESALTDKEAPGFLYAYELRDRQSDTATFFKVGRTGNVPRRMGEWTKRCRSHAPTLRDIFPLSTSAPGMSPNRKSHNDNGGGLHRNPTLPTSFLPGAFRQTTNPARTCPAVKRWERLVHIELADRSSTGAPCEYASLKERCAECQAVHREIFPLPNEGRVYEDTVMEIICRWERFVEEICSS